MPTSDTPLLCFAGYTLDLRRGRLHHGAREIALRPKSFALLCYLAKNAGRVISKDDLAAALWPEAIVTDESVARCVSDVRAGLGDRGHRLIKTVARRGYLFEPRITSPPVAPLRTLFGVQAPVALAFPKEASPSPGLLNGSAAPPEVHRPAERRQLTILACEWIGLASLSAQLDPEDLELVLAACHAQCAEIIRRYNGYVAPYFDDGVVAYFGYPEAHEHDAEHAVRAGLALVEPGAFPDSRFGQSLRLRIGVASGVAVIGSEIAAGTVREQAIGDAFTLARRLRDAADAGNVLIAQSTLRLVGRLFDYRLLDAVAVKGLAEPVKAYEVLGASRFDSRFDARRDGALTPLVGREEELELLQRRWRKAQGGDGRVVLVSGEPGIGKSRLIASLEERLQAAPRARVSYFCSPLHADSALFPVIRQLERVAGLERADPPEQKRLKLTAVLAPCPDHDEALLADLLSLPSDGACQLPDMGPHQRKDKTLAALLTQLESLARRGPVLLVYEDVHWADPTTRELLERVVERVERLPVLLVLTFRPEFDAPWIGQAHVTSLTLNRLDRRDAMALVGRVAGNLVLAQAMAAEIAERADGIPLFLEELTKAILEAGAIDDGEKVLGVLPAPLRVPATLRASLLARLDRLGPAAKEIAQIGAVIGREFGCDLLALVAGADDTPLKAALAALTNAGLLFRRGTLPHATFFFKHALVQDIAYDTLLRDRRRECHARVADALEKNFPDVVVAQPELLARHCTAARLTERAITFWLKAGKRAVQRCALIEAVSQLHKGLELVASLPKGVSRDESELELQIALGWALRAARGAGAAAVGETFARARQLCEQLAEPLRVRPVLFGLSMYHWSRGEFEQMRGLAAELLRIGEQDDTDAKALGLVVSILNSFYGGEFAAVAQYYDRWSGVAAPASLGPTPQRAEDPQCSMLGYLARSLFARGYLDQARRRRHQALTRARQLSHSFTLDSVFFYGLLHYRISTSALEVLKRVNEFLAWPSEDNFIRREFVPWIPHLCRAVLGQERDGLAFVAQRLTTPEAAKYPLWGMHVRVWLADAHRQLNETKEGLEQTNEAIRIAEATGLRYAEAEMLTIRGELLARAGDVKAAEQSFRRAITVARSQTAKLYELRASVGLARLWQTQGNRREAHDALAPVHGWFTEGLDTPDLKEARALVDQLA